MASTGPTQEAEAQWNGRLHGTQRFLVWSKKVVAEQTGIGWQTPSIRVNPPLQSVQTVSFKLVQVALLQSDDMVQGTQRFNSESKNVPDPQFGIGAQTPL